MAYPVLNGPTTTHQVRKLRPVIKFLSGDYYTLEMKSKQTKNCSPLCYLSPLNLVENTKHILIICPATSHIRSRYLDILKEILPTANTPINISALNNFSIFSDFSESEK